MKKIRLTMTNPDTYRAAADNGELDKLVLADVIKQEEIEVADYVVGVGIISCADAYIEQTGLYELGWRFADYEEL